jgi:hypothetical protein
VVDSRGRAAQLDVHAPAHETRDQILVGVPGRACKLRCVNVFELSAFSCCYLSLPG